MTEGSFIQEKNRLRNGIAAQQAIIQKAHEQIKFYEDWLIDLMDAAQQEPWWGEAND